MADRRTVVRMAGVVMAALALSVFAQGGESFSDEQIKKGSAIYSQNCSPCHGPRMMDPQGPFDLRKFPPSEKNRFVTSVAKGKNQMPPWGDLFKPEEIEALWAYVMAGER